MSARDVRDFALGVAAIAAVAGGGVIGVTLGAVWMAVLWTYCRPWFALAVPLSACFVALIVAGVAHIIASRKERR